MKRKHKKIIYDPSLATEKESNIISEKLGENISVVKKLIESLPAGAKWLLAVLIGGVISGLVGLVISIYFNIGFANLEEVNIAFRIQFIVDAVLFAMIAVFIGLLLKETYKAR